MRYIIILLVVLALGACTTPVTEVSEITSRTGTEEGFTPSSTPTIKASPRTDQVQVDSVYDVVSCAHAFENGSIEILPGFDSNTLSHFFSLSYLNTLYETSQLGYEGIASLFFQDADDLNFFVDEVPNPTAYVLDSIQRSFAKELQKQEPDTTKHETGRMCCKLIILYEDAD